MRNPFRYFNSSPELIRLTVLMYSRYPLSLWQVEDLLFERGIDICDETVRFWWNRFGPMFAAAIRKRRVQKPIVLDLALARGRGVREKSMARHTICGALWITKARSSSCLPRSGGITWLR
jgi:hypothetical protein